MNWKKFCPNLKFTVENKIVIDIKQGRLHFEHNKWDNPLPQILKIYQWIGKNIFSIGKSGILSPVKNLGIELNLCKSSRFWCDHKWLWASAGLLVDYFIFKRELQERWGHVLEMTFSSINLDCCSELFGSVPVNWVIYNEDPLLIIYRSIPYWNILPQVEILKNSQNLENIH